MSPVRTPQKAVTPASVKVFMLVEAGIVGFLTFWLGNEYVYNAYFQSYVNQAFVSHVTAYTAALGLGIGLTGSAVAATLYRNLRNAKHRLEMAAAPKIRGAVEKILSSLPTLDELSSPGVPRAVVASETTSVPATPKATETVSVVKQSEPEEKPS